MHACSTEFGSVPENAPLANDYAIVAGASHCEPMLYNNVKWNEKQKGPWNYSTNRDAIHAAWEDSAKSRGADEAVWTLGIRGIHDAAMEAPRDTSTRIKILTDVIHDERQLLDQYVTKKYGPIAQCFVPYKEVQPIYDAGLKVPDDVTLVWTDDNFGYIRRLSSPERTCKRPGAGVYYHLSYYGGPHSYTWINTTAARPHVGRTPQGVGQRCPHAVGPQRRRPQTRRDRHRLLSPTSPGTPPPIGPDSQPRPSSRDFAARTFGEQTANNPSPTSSPTYYRLGSIRKPEIMQPTKLGPSPSPTTKRHGPPKAIIKPPTRSKRIARHRRHAFP